MRRLWPRYPQLVWAHSLATGLVAAALKDRTELTVDAIVLEAPIKSLLHCMKVFFMTFSKSSKISKNKLWKFDQLFSNFTFFSENSIAKIFFRLPHWQWNWPNCGESDSSSEWSPIMWSVVTLSWTRKTIFSTWGHTCSFSPPRTTSPFTGMQRNTTSHD